MVGQDAAFLLSLNKIIAFYLRFYRPMNGEERSDVAQDLVLHILEKVVKRGKPTDEKYVSRAVKNGVIDIVRRRNRNREIAHAPEWFYDKEVVGPSTAYDLIEFIEKNLSDAEQRMLVIVLKGESVAQAPGGYRCLRQLKAKVKLFDSPSRVLKIVKPMRKIS